MNNWSDRVTQRLDPNPEMGLNANQAVLRHSLRKGGPDSPRAVDAMIAVADQLKMLQRYGEEVLLREQIVEVLHSHFEPNHEHMLRAELRLGMCLVDLERAEDAEPLLAHVVEEGENSPGVMSLEVREAMIGLSVVHGKARRLVPARQLLERVLSDFELHGQSESAAAMDLSMYLATILFRLDELEDATLLYRHILDVRGRTLGSDDPETLDSLESLVYVLKHSDHLAEAKVLAISLLERRIRRFGQQHSETSKARELLASVDAPDA